MDLGARRGTTVAAVDDGTMLRYGDGSPFPFDEDFLGIVVDAVDACTAMFEAADELEQKRAKARESRRDLDAEDRRLEVLEKSIVMAISQTDSGGNVSRRTAKRALAQVRKTIDASRTQLRRHVVAEPRPGPAASRVHEAAQRFFDRHCLPATRWTWSWYATHAEATAASGRFTAAFDLELAPPWCGPIRIAELASGAVVRLPRPRLFGAPIVAPVEVDKLWLVGASRDAAGIVLAIRERPTAARGWRLELPDHGQATCVAVDRRGREIGGAHELLRDAATTRLVEVVDAAIAGMRANRHTREVCLDGEPLAVLVDVAAAGRAMIAQLEPTIRAIRAKSRVPGELCLKRDIAAGVREELFVPRATITARYANLSAEYKALLDDAGLGGALTGTFTPSLSAATTIPRMHRPATAA
jgi:hypothetical protein